MVERILPYNETTLSEEELLTAAVALCWQGDNYAETQIFSVPSQQIIRPVRVSTLVDVTERVIAAAYPYTFVICGWQMLLLLKCFVFHEQQR